MNYERFIDPNSTQNEAHLVYNKGRGLLIDPHTQWEDIHQFIQLQGIHILYVLVTEITFEKTYLISEIKRETGAKFFCFQTDLLKLRNLPRWADEKNVCGVKIPHVDGFLKLQEPIQLGEFEVTIVGNENSREYQVGKLRVPTK